jgi:hypothetical protein
MRMRQGFLFIFLPPWLQLLTLTLRVLDLMPRSCSAACFRWSQRMGLVHRSCGSLRLPAKHTMAGARTPRRDSQSLLAGARQSEVACQEHGGCGTPTWPELGGRGTLAGHHTRSG